MDESATCDKWPNITFVQISDAQYNGVGTFLVVSFFFAVSFHLLSLLVSVMSKEVLLKVVHLPELALLIADLGVLGLHPFSGSAAFIRRWVWGQAGCQLYSFFGFWFGVYQMYACAFASFARYKELKTRDSNEKPTMKRYATILVLLMAFAFFWAIAPVFGWATYNLTKAGIVCTLDWHQNDTSFITYVVCFAIFAFVIPILVNLWFIALTIQIVRPVPQHAITWSRKNNIAMVMLGRCFGTFLPFCGYGAVCLFCIVADPNNLTSGAILMPPPLVKLASVFNAFFFIYMNPTMWAAIKKLLGCKYEKALLILPKSESNAENVNLSPRYIDEDQPTDRKK